MKVHFIQHEIFEAPGALLEWVQTRKYDSSFTKVFEHNPFPETEKDIDLLIVLGGPQNPNTTEKDCPHFNAVAEIAFIQKCIQAEKAVFGICLGAQLIGEASGAKFEHSPEKEIGVFAIQLTATGMEDDKISHIGPSFPVGHWHNDMPGLTIESKVLATSIGCPRQIVAYSNLVYGFQCHLEFTTEVVKMLIAEEEVFTTHETNHQFVQNPNEILLYNYNEMNQKLFHFLDKLVREYRQLQFQKI